MKSSQRAAIFHRPVKELEDENRRKDRIIARPSLEVDAMKELAEKNGWTPRSGKKL
jgi:hypothetical protein